MATEKVAQVAAWPGGRGPSPADKTWTQEPRRRLRAGLYSSSWEEPGACPIRPIRSVVRFYTLALEIGRIADGALTAEEAYKAIHSATPRLKMYASPLIGSYHS